jgi:hypothetical protein
MRMYRIIRKPEGVKKRGIALSDLFRMEKTPAFSCFWIASHRNTGALTSPATRRRTIIKVHASIPRPFGDRNDSMFAVVTTESPDVDMSITRVFSDFIGNHRMMPITIWQNKNSGRALIHILKKPVCFVSIRFLHADSHNSIYNNTLLHALDGCKE